MENISSLINQDKFQEALEIIESYETQNPKYGNSGDTSLVYTLVGVK